MHGVDDVVVQPIQFLQQVELLADLEQAGVLGDGQPEQLLAPRVRGVLAVQRVEVVLVDHQAVRRLAGGNIRHHRASLEEDKRLNKSF